MSTHPVIRIGAVACVLALAVLLGWLAGRSGRAILASPPPVPLPPGDPSAPAGQTRVHPGAQVLSEDFHQSEAESAVDLFLGLMCIGKVDTRALDLILREPPDRLAKILRGKEQAWSGNRECAEAAANLLRHFFGKHSGHIEGAEFRDLLRIGGAVVVSRPPEEAESIAWHLVAIDRGLATLSPDEFEDATRSVLTQRVRGGLAGTNQLMLAGMAGCRDLLPMLEETIRAAERLIRDPQVLASPANPGFMAVLLKIRLAGDGTGDDGLVRLLAELRDIPVNIQCRQALPLLLFARSSRILPYLQGLIKEPAITEPDSVTPTLVAKYVFKELVSVLAPGPDSPVDGLDMYNVDDLTMFGERLSRTRVLVFRAGLKVK